MSPAERLVGREPVLAAAGAVLGDAARGLRAAPADQRRGRHRQDRGAGRADRRRPAPDCPVLRGFCWEGNGAPPYWPWSQVLRATGRPMRRARRRPAGCCRPPSSTGRADGRGRGGRRAVPAVRGGRPLPAPAWPPTGPCWWCSTTCTGPTSRRCGCWGSWPAPLAGQQGAAARRLPGHRGIRRSCSSSPARRSSSP